MIQILSLLLISLAGLGSSIKHDHVWPQPQSVHLTDQYLLIHTHEFKIVPNSQCDLLTGAIKRYQDRFFVQDCGKLHTGFSGKLFIPRQINHSMDKNNKGMLKELVVKFDGDCQHWPQMNANEKYSITVDAHSATIHGGSIWGALRGLETFSQLLFHLGRDEFAVNLGHIEDHPRFSHRGLLIDSSRHFLSMHSIAQTLDAMEMNKLNVLHWHIVDDQSFPFVSETFPELSRKGAFEPNTHVYKKEDVQFVLEFARQRGIRVLVEFDSPGHTWSWGRGENNLLTRCYDKNGHPNGGLGPIDPTADSNYEFIRKLFAEISHRFPDQYLHLGGDEVDFSCWASNPQIHEFMNKHKMATDYAKLESYYIQKLLDMVKGMNKSYIVWEEVFNNHVQLKPDTVVHVWLPKWQTEMAKVVKAGYHSLLSAPWYLDLISYGSDWERYYQTEPLNFQATDAEKKLVLGGEACLWGEFVNGANLVSRAWPRASAIAERLWSAASVHSAAAARPRFHENYCRMMKQGLRVQPQDGPGNWCQCDVAL